MTEKSITWSNGTGWCVIDADAAVEVVGLVPDALEVGRVVLVQEELVVLGPVGAVGVAQHAQGVGGGDVVALGHQLGDLLLAASPA